MRGSERHAEASQRPYPGSVTGFDKARRSQTQAFRPLRRPPEDSLCSKSVKCRAVTPSRRVRTMSCNLSIFLTARTLSRLWLPSGQFSSFPPLKLGTDEQHSRRHRMPFDSRNQGSKCV